MKSHTRALLFMLAGATLGFGRGESNDASCREAGDIVSSISTLSGEQLVKQENQVLQLCPDGAPGHAVVKMRHKRSEELQKLADAQLAAGYDERAADAFRQLLSIDESNIDIRYTLGVLYERQGVLDKAEYEYRLVVLQDPGNSDARRHLADIYALRGDLSNAIVEYRELSAQYKDNPLLHFNLARLYERDNRYQDSIAEYLEAIRLSPETVAARRELADLCRKTGNGDEAAAQYRALLDLDRNDASARNALIALYVKQKKYPELFELIKEGVELFPDDPNCYFRLGLMYGFRNEYDASIAEYKKALALKSDHAQSLKGLGKVYLKLGNLEKAREYLEAANKADPKLFETSELLNNLHIEQMRAKAAKYRKKQALKKRSKQLKKKKSGTGKKGRNKHSKKNVKKSKKKRSKSTKTRQK